MKIVFCSSEVYPFAKTGGLADVAGSLPFALAKKGCQVKVFMPLYKGIKPQKMLAGWGVTRKSGVDFIFVKHNQYFLRKDLYGEPGKDYVDNLERFSFLSRKIIEILKEINFSPDIIHNNDWQTSLVSVYLKKLYSNVDIFKKTKTVLTIHNLAYQGLFDKSHYPALELSHDLFNIDGFEFYGKINLLKCGIIFADRINTVSPTYAKQIQTPDYGCGLDGLLRQKRAKLCGILNALDYTAWNPKTDKHIYKNYSLQTLSLKENNKLKLQKEMGLSIDKSAFLMGMVARLTEQKGIDITLKALDYLLKRYQIIILGLGDAKYHKLLKAKAKKYPRSLALSLKFDETIAHKIYASCDAFLMPSRFEPCGLAQMISYKYGTVPIAHATGGLADTIKDYSANGTGFLFKKYSSYELIDAINRAAKLWKNKKSWFKLIKKDMKIDFSWGLAAEGYIRMYKLANYK